MPAELINPEGRVRHPDYDHVAIAAGTKHVHVAGQVAWNEQGELVASDLTGQVVQVLRNVATALGAVGATFDDVVRVTWYAAGWKREMYDDFHAGLEQAAQELGPLRAPLSLIGVDVLFEPGNLIEAEVTAVLA